MKCIGKSYRNKLQVRPYVGVSQLYEARGRARLKVIQSVLEVFIAVIGIFSGP